MLLNPPREVLAARLAAREAAGGHFMPASLLDSQLAALEPGHPGDWLAVLDGREGGGALLDDAEAAAAAIMDAWLPGAALSGTGCPGPPQ